jgi:hypothetical protein
MANNFQQTDIFSLFGIEDEYMEKKKREEEERQKRLEEIKKKQEESKKNAQTSSPSSNNKTKKKEEGDPFEVNLDTFVYHLGEQIPLTEYFTTEEITEGVLVKKKDGVEYKKIDAEEVRKRLEKDYPDLIAAFVDMVYIKKKNMIMAVPKARKKGLTAEADCKQPSTSVEGCLFAKRIPFSILQDFVAISRFFAKEYGTEVHGDIYYDLDKQKFFLDIPEQVAHSLWVERTESPYTTAMKLMDIKFIKVGEIHSHHTMLPIPSSQDDESEVQRGMLYIIVGCVNQFFPQITVRVFDQGLRKHIPLDPFSIFENPFDTIPTKYDLSVVEVSRNGR